MIDEQDYLHGKKIDLGAIFWFKQTWDKKYRSFTVTSLHRGKETDKLISFEETDKLISFDTVDSEDGRLAKWYINHNAVYLLPVNPDEIEQLRAQVKELEKAKYVELKDSGSAATPAPAPSIPTKVKIQNGKGSAPRNISSQFVSNYDQIDWGKGKKAK